MKPGVTIAAISRATEAAARAVGLDCEEAQAAIELALEVLAIDHEPLPGLKGQTTKIVRMLQAARGKAVPREVLADAVCPEADLKAVDVHVCKLRAHPAYRDAVVTVHGVGWAWRPRAADAAPGAAS